MKQYDFKGIIQVISEASPSHLAIVSFLVLPIVMNYWLETLVKAFPEISSSMKVFSLLILIAIYLLCLWWLAKENDHRKKLEQQRDQIVGRFISNNWTKIGFDSARKSLTEEVTDEQIISVIEAFPKTLRYIRMRERDDNRNPMKGSDGKYIYKHGIGLISPGEKQDDENA